MRNEDRCGGTVAAVQVIRISFDAPCRYCRRRAITNIRPVEAIGSPMVADLYVCESDTLQGRQDAPKWKVHLGAMMFKKARGSAPS
jgi:hypothetical protein